MLINHQILEVFMALIKNMKASYLESWRTLLGNGLSEWGKLFLYRCIKAYFGMEPYLKHVKKLKFRRAMTAFRLRAHNLEIEMGKYFKDRTI